MGHLSRPAATSSRPVPRSDAPIRLRAEPETDGWTLFAEGAEGARALRVAEAGRDRPLPPVLDGPAFAALPLALRAGRPLHVEGRLSRGALRNLREVAEAWADWAPNRYAAVAVAAREVVDEAPPPPGGPVLAAWGGDLRSTFLAAGGEPALQAAGLDVGRAVHVLGLGDPAPAPAALDRLRGAFAAAGTALVAVATNARQAGWLDPVIGPMPVVAAALHLAGDGVAGLAVHARSGPVRAQLVRPRPAPTLGDVWGGDRLAILAAGGTTSAPAMAAHVDARPAFGPLAAGCRATAFAPPRCGRCRDCALLDLGRAGAGLGRGAARSAAARPPLSDAWHEAEAALALEDWSGSAARRAALAARVAARAARRALEARARWRDARDGRGEPWPR